LFIATRRLSRFRGKALRYFLFLIAIESVDDVPTFQSWFHPGFGLTAAAEAKEIYRKVKKIISQQLE
jgi:hypothetical protein